MPQLLPVPTSLPDDSREDELNLQPQICLDLLKTITKDLVVSLESCGKRPIGDGNDLLAPLCEAIETVLRNGLKRSVLGLVRWDYWDWIQALPASLPNDRKNVALVYVITAIKTSKKLPTSLLRGRVFIRMALSKKLLRYTVESLARDRTLTRSWYGDDGILCDKVRRETFMEALADLELRSFNLNFKNASFLEESWLIPVIKEVEIVPCKELGLIIRHVDHRVVVASVTPTSSAGDVGIEVGDIIDELLGQPLLKVKNGKLTDLLKHNYGKPVLCIIVKCKLKNGKPFPPSVERMKVIGADPYKPKEKENTTGPQQLASWDETPVHSGDTIASYSAVYYGRVDVGDILLPVKSSNLSDPNVSIDDNLHYLEIPPSEEGGVAVIEDSIIETLKKANPPKLVDLNLSETNIVVTERGTDKVLSVHSFTETSSCGRRNDRKDVIAFVSGETSCAIAKKFYCYVFQMTDEVTAKVILYCIADGFCRTVWFV